MNSLIKLLKTTLLKGDLDYNFVRASKLGTYWLRYATRALGLVQKEIASSNPFFTTKANGMGLGLSIPRSLIEAHGGRLWAAPNSPDGAAFYFTLPMSNWRP
jgi:light-regulated signal transduction histidine kinase (bacteriophytochrome)